MVEKNERKVLRMLCAGSIVLDFISEQGTGEYKGLEKFISYPTLNVCLKVLLNYGLREPFLERIGKKREWYELTIKGNNPCSAQSSSWNYPKIFNISYFPFVIKC